LTLYMVSATLMAIQYVERVRVETTWGRVAHFARLIANHKV